MFIDKLKRKQASAFINIPVMHRTLPGQHHRTAFLLKKIIFLHIFTAAEQAIAHLKENKIYSKKEITLNISPNKISKT